MSKNMKLAGGPESIGDSSSYRSQSKFSISTLQSINKANEGDIIFVRGYEYGKVETIADLQRKINEQYNPMECIWCDATLYSTSIVEEDEIYEFIMDP